MQRNFKHLRFKKWYHGGPIWCLFTFSTKVRNICNFHMSATPKVGVHLGIIGFHPLHSPSIVRVYFTPKHTFGLMGPYTLDFVANPMLGLGHSTNSAKRLEN